MKPSAIHSDFFGLVWPAALVMLACAGCGDGQMADPDGEPSAEFAYPGGIRQITGFSPAGEDIWDTETSRGIRSQLIDAGFRWIRYYVDWNRIEQTRGELDWTTADERLDALIDEGFEPLGLLPHGNALYTANPEDCEPIVGGAEECAPEDLEDFARFAGEAAARYRGRIGVWEIWNEPNNWFRFWADTPGGDPARYARLTRLAAEAIRENCPECVVLSGGLVYIDYSPVVVGQEQFMADMVAAEPDLFETLQGVGVHYYGTYPPVVPPEEIAGPQIPLADALDATAEHCDCDLPLYITETGWTAVRDLTRLDQARYALRSYLIALTREVRMWLWWSIRELSGGEMAAPEEANFGMFTAEGQPNLVFTVMADFLTEYGDAVAAVDVTSDYGLEKPRDWAVRLMWADGRTALVLWSNVDDDDDADAEGPPVPDGISTDGAVDLVTGEAVEFTRLGHSPVLIRE